MMCRPPGRCTTPFTLSVWPRIVLRGMITSSSVSSFFLTGIWRSQVRQVVQYGCERLPEKPARIKVELKRVVWQQKIFLVSRLAYHIACLRESSPHPEANFSTVYTRVVYQGMRSYLSGYPKSAKFRQAQCSNQWAFGSRLRRLGVRLFMLSFIKVRPMCYPRARFASLNCCVDEVHRSVASARYIVHISHISWTTFKVPW
ncbi:hypothetical protein BD769DRAFT_1478654 [Suillus cothurnatus]|nr:hypothetical protein BD769DRAFT_1478654 [Suillus cothurnatus]